MDTGLGGIVCAMLPHILTVSIHKVLRTCVGFVWYLMPMLQIAQWVVLPKPLIDSVGQGRRDKDDDDVEDIEDDSAGLLVWDAPSAPIALVTKNSKLYISIPEVNK
jgi:hypothetical protein